MEAVEEPPNVSKFNIHTMQVEYVSVDKLKYDKENRRRHDKRNIDSIKSALKRFGQQKPIVVDHNNVVVAGNGTLRAARSLGWSNVGVVRSDLNGSERLAYGIADNRTAELAEWDDHLGASLGALYSEDPELLDVAGFSLDELEEMTCELAETAPVAGDGPYQEDDEEEVFEISTETQTGELVDIEGHKLFCGDCIEMLQGLEDNSVDAICTDPPYGIGFMGKGWDCDVPGDAFAAEAFRVLKPGAHLIAFAATRTIHRLTTALEDAGFEIRDQIAHLQWQGYPKSLNISKEIDRMAGAEREVIGEKRNDKKRSPLTMEGNWEEGGRRGRYKEEGDTFPVTAPATDDAKKWDGWGTALKPSMELAVLCRKPLEGTVAENVLKWGTGGLNIDGCRFQYGDPAWPGPQDQPPAVPQRDNLRYSMGDGEGRSGETFDNTKGRWPANIYYCKKPNRNEREFGCDDLPGRAGHQAVERKPDTAGLNNPRAGAGRTAEHVKNYHPTVKPKKMMEYMVRLITPPGGMVVDPFAGSGTTLVAAQYVGVKCIAAEREPDYCDIIRARVAAATSRTQD